MLRGALKHAAVHLNHIMHHMALNFICKNLKIYSKNPDFSQLIKCGILETSAI